MDTAALCLRPEAAYGSMRGEALVATAWPIEDRDREQRFGEFAAVLTTAVSALSSADTIQATDYNAALLPFARIYDSNPSPETRPALPCESANADARVVDAVQPQYPLIAGVARTSGKVLLKVTLSKAGYVRSVSVFSETLGDKPGADLMVDAAILAAGGSTYAPGVINCRLVSGSYLFTTDSGPNNLVALQQRIMGEYGPGGSLGLQNRRGLRKGTGRFDSYTLPPTPVANKSR